MATDIPHCFQFVDAPRQTFFKFNFGEGGGKISQKNPVFSQILEMLTSSLRESIQVPLSKLKKILTDQVLNITKVITSM